MLYLKGIYIALQGLPLTLIVSIIAVVVGMVVGLALAMMKLSKSGVLRIISGAFIEVIRSTPMIVQALIFAFGIPMLLQQNGIMFKWPSLIIPAVLVCIFNSSAYIAEIFRGGIQAVDPGQVEAANSLGMTKWQVNKHIVFPQAFRYSIPALGNEFVTMIKETAILSFVGVIEVLRKAALWAAADFQVFQAYLGAAVVYFAVCYPLAKGISRLEKKLDEDSANDDTKDKQKKLLIKAKGNNGGLR